MQKARPAQGRRILRCMPSQKVRGILLYVNGCGAFPGRLRYISQPGLEGVILPLHYPEERLLQFMRDRTGASAPNRTIVHFANRGKLSGCPCEEYLIGNIEFVARKDRFVDCQSEVAGQIDHGIARDALKNRSKRRRLEFTAPDNEDVFARAFRDIALDIQHNRLIIASVDRFHFGQLRIGVIADDLSLRHHNVYMVPCKGRDTDANPRVQGSFTEICPPRPHSNGRADGIVTVVDAHLTIAQIDQRTDVALPHLVDVHRVKNRTPYIILRPCHLHASDMRRMKQALDMFLEAENGWALRRVIAPNALKDTEPIVQRMTEYVYLGLVPVYKLSIHPNFLCGLHDACLPQDPGAFARAVISALCGASL